MYVPKLRKYVPIVRMYVPKLPNDFVFLDSLLSYI